MLLLWVAPAVAAAETIEVNTTNDGLPREGEESCTGAVGITCTLREAIGLSNADSPVPDSIAFAKLPAGQTELLVEETSLPAIIRPVRVEGDTAPGATAGVPALELVPRNLSEEGFTAGFEVHEGTGTRIEGFAIGGFDAGIEVGPADSEEAEGPSDTQICGNYLGVELDGTTAEPNVTGVEVWSPTETERPKTTHIGGAGCAGNAISGNSSFGVLDYGLGTTIAGNRIGFGPEPGDLEMPNGTNHGEGGAAGIREEARASGGMIGGTAPGGGEGNLIWFNDGPGVSVEGSAGEVSIRQNSFLENEGKGIEIIAGTPLAPPTIESASTPAVHELEVKGTVTGNPGEEIELEFFGNRACDPSGSGQGQTLLGTSFEPVFIGAGPTPYTFVLPVEVAADQTAITATGTREAGTGGTSEFSTCATYTPPAPAPAAAITGAPPVTTTATEASFAFAAPGATGFECSLDVGVFGPCTSPQKIAGLAPGTHSFAVRSTGIPGQHGEPTVYDWTVTSPQQQATGSTAPPPVEEKPTPTNGEKVVVQPEEGKVLIKLPGSKKFVPLEELKEIPVGAVIDATKGKVKLTSIGPDGTEQTANFFGGVFKVKQREGAGLVVLELLDTNVCPAPRSGGKPRLALASSLSARPGSGTSGKLWGSGHGNFRTEGNNGSATVRGTIWLVEDRCNGTTFFRTRRGIVTVRDFTTRKTLPLLAGKTYVAGEG